MGLTVMKLLLCLLITTIVLDVGFGFGFGFGGIEDVVGDLPGQPKVEFKHYAGYISVDDTNGRSLFYWFYETSSLPNDKPLVLWLNGGPGCSSVGYGATQEIGPFLLDTNGGDHLTLNPFSWNKEANILFLESPIGVGFSYSNTTTDYDQLGDDFTAKDSYTFLRNWFKKFPSYKKRDFYIAGESYAGKYVPQLAELIYEKNKSSSFHIPLKGILLGNPETSEAEDWKGLVDYAWSHAVISYESHDIISRNCNFSSDSTFDNVECKKTVDELLDNYKKIDMYSIYEPLCAKNFTGSTTTTTKTTLEIKRKGNMMPRMLGGYDPCEDHYAASYYNRADVQKALHASNGQKLRNWGICNDTIFDNWSSSKPSVLPVYKKLMGAGFRIWVYSGDADGRVPLLGTEYCLASLHLPIKTAWKPWYHKAEVSGWFQEYVGLTFATFRGAGHAVPSYKPSESLAFFAAFLRGGSPPSVRN